MDIGRVKPAAARPYVPAAAGSAGGSATGSFGQQLGNQMKEQYRQRFAMLFDALTGDATDILSHMDLSKWEQYRRLIGDLLREVVEHAYHLHSERVGTRRIYTTVSVIDGKLEELTRLLMNKNSAQLTFLSRVDELRGLVTDLLL